MLKCGTFKDKSLHLILSLMLNSDKIQQHSGQLHNVSTNVRESEQEEY